MHSSMKSLLLVEDNEFDVLKVRRMMRRLSLEFPVILHARNGEEALELLTDAESDSQTDLPDAMILDINMPRMDGFELLENLSENTQLSSIPVYIVSTSDSEHDTCRAREFNVRNYIVKPLTETGLISILNTH